MSLSNERQMRREIERLREYEQAHIISIHATIPIEYLASLGDAVYGATYGVTRKALLEHPETEAKRRKKADQDRFGNMTQLETAPSAAARASFTRAHFESAPPTGHAGLQSLVDREVRYLRRRAQLLATAVDEIVGESAAA